MSRASAEHERCIRSGAGLVLGVFEQAGRAHSEGIRDLGEKYLQVFLQLCREWRGQKLLQDFSVVVALQGEIEQVILRHELVEGIGGPYESGRYSDANARKAAGEAVLAQQMTHKSEAARFASQGSGTDSQKPGVGWLERFRVEVADQ